ncbi:P-loop containing nucleoside triphosphate hydrolase protein [Parasitella parasitica]|nr:P-loop containing nucleoside triphosphate hydrolase protein [Parasitella parasitica]
MYGSICTKPSNNNNNNTSTTSANKPKSPSTSISSPTRISSSLPYPKIKVCIRKRPLNRHEIATNEPDTSELISSRTIEIHAPKQKVDLTKYTLQHSFTFDHVFDCNASNESIYQQTIQPLVEHMLRGGKATCFAYGQTGSGKTFTMLDPRNGLYFLAINQIFELLKDHRYAGLQTWVGYYEIYQGQLLDLLNNRKKLAPREDGKGNVVITGLKEHRVHSLSTLKQVFEFGNRDRSTCKTQTNANSSRSHAVLQVLLKNRKLAIHGKLNFIDLAGSERGSDRGRNTDTKTRLEGAEINRSLLALKECIRALDQDKGHAPFRGSKLTMVLRDSFVGSSMTCMIATISPNQSNSDHTLNTLRYANRVKELRGESIPKSSLNYGSDSQPSTITAPCSTVLDEHAKLLDHEYEKITLAHIKDFLHHHRIQVGGLEDYVRGSIELLDGFELDFRRLMSTRSTANTIRRRYADYKNKLHIKSMQVSRYLMDLKKKIKEELEDEQLD